MAERDLSADELKLTEGLLVRMRGWYDRWHQHFVPSLGWDDPEVGRDWLAEGSRIAYDLRVELPGTDVVEHFRQSALGAAPEGSLEVYVRPEERFFIRSPSPGARARRELRMFPEWGNDWPLWEAEGRGPSTSADQSGLSPGLIRRLQSWNDTWLGHVSDETGWDDPALARAWLIEGRGLAMDLRAELGDEFTVFEEFAPTDPT